MAAKGGKRSFAQAALNDASAPNPVMAIARSIAWL
jgi:hypothetical protein